jgi:type VI secretion system VasI family protein
MSPRAGKILSALALCALTPGAALAQPELLMFGLCRKIPDNAARLKCFDAIVPAPQQAAPQQADQPKAVQEWSIEDSKSSVDGSPEVFATLTSEDGRSELIIRCKDRKTQLAVLPSGLFALERGTVLLQINDGPAVTATWSASSNSKGLFASNAVALIKTLPDGGKLFVRATGYNRQADDATFQLGAMTVVKNRVSAACKWPPEGASSPPKTGPARKKK